MIRYLSMAVLLLAAGAAGAQNAEAIPGASERPIPTVENVPTDPRLAQLGKLPLTVEVRPVSAMAEGDKELESTAQAAIRQNAALFELGLNEGDWQESQLVCPAFPQHLFLRFTRNMGAGDVSMFTASIPRAKDGRVRVIPILRRGYSVISPAPESKATIGAFNQIRAEEHMGGKADWSAVSVCYAALSSERWKEPHQVVALTMVGSQTLELVEHGGLNVALELADPAPGRWAISYDGAGRVVKAEYTPFGDLMWRPLPPPAAELKGKPLPAAAGEQAGRPVSTAPEPPGKPIPSPTDNPDKPQ